MKMMMLVFALHQHKRVVWTVLGVAVLASLSAIQHSFQVSSIASRKWRLLDELQERPLMMGGGGGTNALQAQRGLLRSYHHHHHRGGATATTTAADNTEDLMMLPEEDADEKVLLLRQQALEIEQLKKDLESANLKALQATATAATAGNVDQPSSSSSPPSPGTVLRLLWKQLKEETPPGKTSRKVLAHWKAREQRDSRDIVLLTHGSLFKLETFLVQLRYWNGPASLALYVNEISETTPDEIDVLETFLEVHREMLRHTSIHVMMEYTNSSKGPLPYPHNPLRNLAMDQCDSDYILALDADFIPHPADCYAKLHSTLFDNDGGGMAKEMRRRKRVMILPAFEIYAPQNKTVATPDQLPASKLELYRLVEANRTESFRVNRYPAGHAPTNFTKWFEPIVNKIILAEESNSTNSSSTAAITTNTSTSIDTTSTITSPPFYPIFYRPGFEPYVLAYRPGIPRYWNDFRGFGQNKLSWFQEMHRDGYLFGSLWDFFVVHLQHPTTFNFKQRNANVIKNEAFLKYLDERYPLRNGMKYVDKRYYYHFENKKVWGKTNSMTTNSVSTSNNNNNNNSTTTTSAISSKASKVSTKTKKKKKGSTGTAVKTNVVVVGGGGGNSTSGSTGDQNSIAERLRAIQAEREMVNKRNDQLAAVIKEKVSSRFQAIMEQQQQQQEEEEG